MKQNLLVLFMSFRRSDTRKTQRLKFSKDFIKTDFVGDKTFRRGTYRKLRIRVKIKTKVESVIFRFYFKTIIRPTGLMMQQKMQ